MTDFFQSLQVCFVMVCTCTNFYSVWRSYCLCQSLNGIIALRFLFTLELSWPKFHKNDRGNKSCLPEEEFCPQGLSVYASGMCTCKVMKKNPYKIRNDSDFHETCNNYQSNFGFLLWSNFCPQGLSDPDIRLYTYIKSYTN